MIVAHDLECAPALRRAAVWPGGIALDQPGDNRPDDQAVPFGVELLDAAEDPVVTDRDHARHNVAPPRRRSNRGRPHGGVRDVGEAIDEVDERQRVAFSRDHLEDSENGAIAPALQDLAVCRREVRFGQEIGFKHGRAARFRAFKQDALNGIYHRIVVIVGVLKRRRHRHAQLGFEFRPDRVAHQLALESGGAIDEVAGIHAHHCLRQFCRTRRCWAGFIERASSSPGGSG